MNLRTVARILLICCFFLAATHGDLFAQKQQSSSPDSVKSSRTTKAVVSKSYAPKTYDTKLPASYLALKYSRSYASSDQCAYETNKGLRCKRKVVPGTLYCKQHGEKYASKEESDKSDSGKRK